MDGQKFILVGAEESTLAKIARDISKRSGYQIETVRMDSDRAATLFSTTGANFENRSEEFGEHLFDRHRAINQLSAVLAGLRALGAELRASLDDPEAIEKILDEYIDSLAFTVRQIGHELNSLKRHGSGVEVGDATSGAGSDEASGQ